MNCIGFNDTYVVYCVNYEAAPIDGVTRIEITDDEYKSIQDKKSYFDLITKKVVTKTEAQLFDEKAKADKLTSMREKRRFLSSTDWKVLRHIREKALGAPTSLSDEEYLLLEQERAAVASEI